MINKKISDKLSKISKKHIVFSFILINILFSLGFYIIFLNSILKQNEDGLKSVESLQNIITQIHKQDSDLYKTLLSNEILITEIDDNIKKDNFVISNLVNLKSSDFFTSQKLASTIEDYYSLNSVREQIIDLHKQNILDDNMVSENSKKISELLEKYETNVIEVLAEINYELMVVSEYNIYLQKNILNYYFIFEFILIILFIILYYGFDLDKSQNEINEVKTQIENIDELILDSDCKKILELSKSNP